MVLEMPRGIASSKQLSMMERVLTAYCDANAVTDSARRAELAALIVQLFDMGKRSEDDLLAELQQREQSRDGGPSPGVPKPMGLQFQ
jgi:hypothetical protein